MLAKRLVILVRLCYTLNIIPIAKEGKIRMSDANLKGVWNNSVPVEKSAYIVDNVQYINYNNLRHNPDKYSMLDLFCGAGGFAVGCSMVGFESVVGIDHFQPAMETWTYNHPNSLGCLGDIKQIDPLIIKEMLRLKGIEKIHLITGGVPCQGFSRANRKHNDNDERNFLFLEYMKYVKVFNPDYIILENVSGMRSTAGGKFEQEIIKCMEELGYSTKVDLLNAAEFGVPQIRQRLIFVGVKRDMGLVNSFEFPEGEFCITAGKTLLDLNKLPCRTVYDAISDLPSLQNGEIKNHYENAPITDYQRLMRGVMPDTNIKPAIALYNHAAPTHPNETILMIANTQPGKPMYAKFKQRIRLSFDDPSPTQLAGGIRPQFQFGHPNQARGLSIRERARIQSFPDSYVFKGGIVQERVQTGNAVPPLLVAALAKSIKIDLDKKYKRETK